MIKQTKKVIEHTVSEYICDRCSRASSYHGHIKECGLCGKCICGDCSYYIDYIEQDLSDEPYYNSDYPSRVCKACWEIGKLYRDKMQTLINLHNMELDKLKKQWEILAKNNTA